MHVLLVTKAYLCIFWSPIKTTAMKKRNLLSIRDEEISKAFGNMFLLFVLQKGTVSRELQNASDKLFDTKEWIKAFEDPELIVGLKILSIWRGDDRFVVESRDILFKYFFKEMKYIQTQAKRERDILIPEIDPDPALFVPIPFHSKF